MIPILYAIVATMCIVSSVYCDAERHKDCNAPKGVKANLWLLLDTVTLMLAGANLSFLVIMLRG